MKTLLFVWVSILMCSSGYTQSNDSSEKIKGPIEYKKEVIGLFKPYSNDTVQIDKSLVVIRINKAAEIVSKFMKVDDVTALGILIGKNEPTRYIISYYRSSKTTKGELKKVKGEIWWE
jgi:hypothetical protein